MNDKELLKVCDAALHDLYVEGMAIIAKSLDKEPSYKLIRAIGLLQHESGDAMDCMEKFIRNAPVIGGFNPIELLCASTIAVLMTVLQNRSNQEREVKR
jgi:hypothetical protein